MPVIIGPTRRDLFRFAAVTAGSVSLARSQAANRSSRWALLADTHISAERDGEYRGFRPFDNLEQAASSISETKPDGCLIAGDLARLQGTPGDYMQLKSGLKTLAETVPAGFCLGNHDDRENFAAAVAASASGELQEVKRKYVAVIQRSPVRIILLDSLIVTNETPGYLGKAQRTWLDKYLAMSDVTPTLLFVHHTLDDEDTSLLDSDRLLRIAAKHANVKAIFYGHSHRYAYDTYEGVHLVNLPALGYSFNDKQPVGWVDAAFSFRGADLTLRAIAGNKTEDRTTRSISWRG